LRSLLLKRVLDLTVSIVGLILFAPIFAAIALLVWITMGSPVLFRQLRPGLHGEPFIIFKFRTMKEIRNEQGELFPDEMRITAIGRFLRKTSLDELPEVFNVIKGEMSLVGPRPLRMEYLDRYTSEQARRHEVKPGITGWAQVNGRNAISWEEKFKYDVWYVDNWSLFLDIKILCLTVIKVLKREGISANGHATMPAFLGSDNKNDQAAG
jgi:lipopolysaccharide/colanic/teichoic acid biosynthesis glycosyltransferase